MTESKLANVPLWDPVVATLLFDATLMLLLLLVLLLLKAKFIVLTLNANDQCQSD